MLNFNINNFAIITVKNVDYRCIILNISKSEAIKSLECSMLEDRRNTQKNIVLNFSLFRAVSFTLFCFSI